MSYMKFSYGQLKSYCHEAFVQFGFTKEEAELLLADLYGIESHGTQRLVRYRKSIQQGCVNMEAKPEIVFETPVSAVIEGHSGMGQLISIYATRLAIKKAKQMGMAFVTVRNSNHFGIAGYYTKMACDEGLIGIATTNSESLMVHTNSRQAILGSNPLAFAMPADPYPFWFDAATTVVPRGKLEVYNKKELPLKEEWAVDETGAVCTDAERVLTCFEKKLGAGGILPVGGSTELMGSHKGYGFGMICELLSSITSGGVTSNHHVKVPGQGSGTCHGFIVIDPAIFGDTQVIKERLSVFMQELRDAKRADEQVPIYTHGEKEMIRYEQRMREGIDVNVKTVKEMVDICKYLGMDVKEYLGDVDK